MLFSSGGASAASQNCSVNGVWQGRIGQAPVTLEIDADYGRYRYRDSLNDLLLQPRRGSDNTWDEYDGSGKQTGSIKLVCDGDAASGTWTSPAGKSAPITVQRASSYEGDRIKNAPLKVLSQKTLSGRTIQYVSIKGVAELQTLQIANPSSSEATVNRKLRQQLDQAVENHLACVVGGFAKGRFSDPFGDTLNSNPVFWMGSVLSISSNYSGYCGGAHPYHAFSYSAFDTTRGVEISFGNWINGDQKSTEEKSEISYDSALGRNIWRVALRGKTEVESLPDQQDRECLGSLNEPTATIASLETKGIGFRYWYPYAQSGCVEDYVVPWKKLKPFLSPEGRQYIEQMERK